MRLILREMLGLGVSFSMRLTLCMGHVTYAVMLPTLELGTVISCLFGVTQTGFIQNLLSMLS